MDELLAETGSGSRGSVVEVTGEPVANVSEADIEEILKRQDGRQLTPFQIGQLEKNARKNWDLFYKTNTTNFFKDRHWTLREFPELLNATSDDGTAEIVLLEAGCGVGNFVFPILEEVPRLFAFACDFSPRAIDFVKSNPEYNEDRLLAFVADLTENDCFSSIDGLIARKADFGSLIFVLSAVSPSRHPSVVTNLSSVMTPGGILFFRDYGRYDMAQLRFKAGKKIQDNFYVRRDGTRSYYFTPDEVVTLFTADNQFSCLECEFIHRRTVNVKEEVNVGRIFVQGKFIKL